MKLSEFAKILFGLFIIVLLHLSSTTSSGGRNNNSSCSGCHGGSAPGTMTLVGLPTQVTPSTTYNVEVCINDNTHTTAMPNAGFRFHTTQGSYANLGSGVRMGGTGFNLGLTQSSPKTLMPGQACWTFDWLSPMSGTTNLTLYGNAANGDGNNTSADHGGYQTFAVIETMDPCATDLVITDNPIPSNTYQASNSITTSTAVGSNGNVVLSAANCVQLEAGFEAPTNATLEAVTGTSEGCLTLPDPSTSIIYDTKTEAE